MRIYHRYVTLKENEKLNKILKEYGIIPIIENKISYSLEFHIYEDDPDFEKKTKAVSLFKDDLFVLEFTIFSKEEEENAEWFELSSTGHFGYPRTEDEYLEKTYNIEKACATCKIKPGIASLYS